VEGFEIISRVKTVIRFFGETGICYVQQSIVTVAESRTAFYKRKTGTN